MIQRILEGPRVLEVGMALYRAGCSDKRPLDMEPAFANCCRVFSKLEVVNPKDQRAFDAKCKEIGASYGGIVVHPDVGAYLGFPGREYSLPPSIHVEEKGPDASAFVPSKVPRKGNAKRKKSRKVVRRGPPA